MTTPALRFDNSYSRRPESFYGRAQPIATVYPQPFHDFPDLLAKPIEWRPEKARYARPPRAEEVVQRTFYGT